MQILASLLCGLIFGAGLLISGMTDPVKVLGFLDVLGRWDPTLAFVMAGALVVSAAGFAVVRRRPTPVLAAAHLWPPRRNVDRALVAGSVMFGIGWGLVGLCPGPALENLAGLSPRVVVFVVAMIAGTGAHALWRSRASRAPPAGDAALSTSDG